MAEAGGNVTKALKTVLKKLEEASAKRTPEEQAVPVRLLAVSKIKPIKDIIEAYDAGQRHFGENYVQELEEKATNAEILEKCKDIKWHLIGHLQGNKVNKVASLPNMYMVETVDSQKLATKLNKSYAEFASADQKLHVLVQINSSGETEKSGIQPTEVTSLAKYILEECPNLKLDGLMTIGKYTAYSWEEAPNPDFVCLKKCRDELCETFKLDWRKIVLSMGMSHDYEHAIQMGSTEIRVGTEIFGARPVKT